MLPGQLDVRRFSRAELKGYWCDASVRMLVVIDVFASLWGPPVYVSPHPRAVGRYDGPDGTSQHNIDRWGEVRAIDLMPEGMTTRETARDAMETALRAGATGIGIYPDWSPRPGIHIDVRADVMPGAPATWGGVWRGDEQDYVAIWDAIEQFPHTGARANA